MPGATFISDDQRPIGFLPTGSWIRSCYLFGPAERLIDPSTQLDELFDAHRAKIILWHRDHPSAGGDANKSTTSKTGFDLPQRITISSETRSFGVDQEILFL